MLEECLDESEHRRCSELPSWLLETMKVGWPLGIILQVWKSLGKFCEVWRESPSRPHGFASESPGNDQFSVFAAVRQGFQPFTFSTTIRTLSLRIFTASERRMSWPPPKQPSRPAFAIGHRAAWNIRSATTRPDFKLRRQPRPTIFLRGNYRI